MASPNQLQRNKKNKNIAPGGSPNQLQRNKSNKPKASPNQLQKNKNNKGLDIFDKGKIPKGNTKKKKIITGGSPNQKFKDSTGGSPNIKFKKEQKNKKEKTPTDVNRPNTDSKKPKSKVTSLAIDYIKQNLLFGPLLGPSIFSTKILYEQYLKKKKA